MQSVTLSPELTSTLTAEANRSGKTLSTLVEEWLRHQYQTLRRERLAFQTRRFWENHATLYARYPNQYVAGCDCPGNCGANDCLPDAFPTSSTGSLMSVAYQTAGYLLPIPILSVRFCRLAEAPATDSYTQ